MSFTGNTTYNVTDGIILTLTTNNQTGWASISQSRGILTEPIIVQSQFRNGGGGGADATGIFFGATGSNARETNNNGGLFVMFDEFNANIVKVYYGNTLRRTFNLFSIMDADDVPWVGTVVIEPSGSNNTWVSVYKDNIFAGAVTCSMSFLTGSRHGVRGWTGGLNNFHRCTGFKIASANSWLSEYGSRWR